MQFSNVFKKLDSVNLVIYKLLSFCNLLIHLLPYDYGSISNGQRLQLKINIPFYVESESAGNP